MIEPINNKVIIKPKVAETKTASGVYLPDSKESTKEGVVVAVVENPKIKTGDTIIFDSFSKTEIKIEGEKHLIMDLKDILAIVRG